MATFRDRGSCFTIPADLLDAIQAVFLSVVDDAETRELLERLDTETKQVIGSLVWTADDLEDIECLPAGLSLDEVCQELESRYDIGDQMEYEYGRINTRLKDLCQWTFVKREPVESDAALTE